MTKENCNVVSEVKEVISSIKNKTQQGENITKREINRLIRSTEELITDYEATIETLNVNNSLVVKYERFMEVVGIIEYISVSKEDVLDKSIELLNSIIDPLKQK